MRFSKIAIDPSHLPAMRAAFEKVCCILGLRRHVDDPITDLVVMLIAEHAMAGEVDADRLCQLTLHDLAPHQVGASPAETRSTLH
jgi:hypothetical protein